jgi:hypothetical protein
MRSAPVVAAKPDGATVRDAFCGQGVQWRMRDSEIRYEQPFLLSVVEKVLGLGSVRLRKPSAAFLIRLGVPFVVSNCPPEAF